MHQRQVSKKKSIYPRTNFLWSIFFLVLLVKSVKGLLEPSVEPSQFLIEDLLAVARAYNDIDDLLKKYEMGKTKKRASELSKTLARMQEKKLP